jgi:hypothetical protein
LFSLWTPTGATVAGRACRIGAVPEPSRLDEWAHRLFLRGQCRKVHWHVQADCAGDTVNP